MRFLLLLSLMACAGSAPATADKTTSGDNKAVAGKAAPTGPVATWSKGSISADELDETLKTELLKLESEYVSSRYDTRLEGLEAMVSEKILEAEVEKRGLADVPALLAAEIDAKITEPTDDEIKQFYAMMARRLGGRPLEEVRPVIVQEITRRATAERFQVFLTEMRDAYGVKITLPRPEVPRIPVSVDDDPSIGPEDAPITIIQFAEFQCPYCGRAKQVIDQVMKKYEGKVRMVYRDFPLSFHDRAIPAAVAANCAGEQGKYWEMYDKLMSNQRALSEDDLTGHATALQLDMDKWNTCRKDPAQAAEVQKDFEDGTRAGVQGTPAFFINGIFLNGAVPLEQFTAIIDAELAG